MHACVSWLCHLSTHPGGKWTTTANTEGLPSTGAIGTVSTHLVKEPQRWTCVPRWTEAISHPLLLVCL